MNGFIDAFFTIKVSYNQFITAHNEKIRVEAGSNTSIMTLRVVGGDEKGSLESETVKYGHGSYGTRTRKCVDEGEQQF
jgi:hypothetical protein